jgi:uncharacterized lipoprotein YehR (DUF1307 family)
MKISDIISSAKNKKYLLISREDLNDLLSQSKILIEENTYISDKIRLLKFKDELILQEKTTKDEFLIRRMKSKEEAEDLIKHRLEIYKRMWDGCGCRIHYYD